MRYFVIDEDRSLRCTGEVDASHRWQLPGVHCPLCDTQWAGSGEAWPGVDLSHLSPRDLAALAEPHLERDFSEFERLQGLVKPLLPAGVQPGPGTHLGPLEGRAHGTFPALFMPYSHTLLARRDALERLAPEALRGVEAYPTALRFRQKRPPELLEFQIQPHGRILPEDLPIESRTPCPRCGRWDVTRPDSFRLLASSLPEHLEVFRLVDMPTAIVVTERFQDAVARLGLDGLLFEELRIDSE